MSKFYVVYRIEDDPSDTEVSSNIYQIYDKEESFLKELKGYLEAFTEHQLENEI